MLTKRFSLKMARRLAKDAIKQAEEIFKRLKSEKADEGGYLLVSVLLINDDFENNRFLAGITCEYLNYCCKKANLNLQFSVVIELTKIPESIAEKIRKENDEAYDAKVEGHITSDFTPLYLYAKLES